MRLFRSLILPQLEYRAAVLAMKNQKCGNESGKVESDRVFTLQLSVMMLVHIRNADVWHRTTPD